MRTTRLLVAGALALGVSAPAPAGAVSVPIGLSGSVTVYPDLGACGSIATSTATTIVGQFAAAGAIQGPGAAAAPVRGATPFAVVRGTGWYGCLPDAYSGATTGYATYELTATTPQSDFVASVHCTVSWGTVRCV